MRALLTSLVVSLTCAAGSLAAEEPDLALRPLTEREFKARIVGRSLQRNYNGLIITSPNGENFDPSGRYLSWGDRVSLNGTYRFSAGRLCTTPTPLKALAVSETKCEWLSIDRHKRVYFSADAEQPDRASQAGGFFYKLNSKTRTAP